MKTIYDYMEEGWKPQLLPNFKDTPDWNKVLGDNIRNYLVSVKLDGIRAEIDPAGNVLTRALKPFRCVQIQKMVKELVQSISFEGILECEIYAHDLTFAELKHFVMSEDVTSAKSVRKVENLWKRTEEGTKVIYNGKKYYENELDELDLSHEELKKVVRWNLPGRTPEWACTFHADIKFYAFNLINPDNPQKFLHRAMAYNDLTAHFKLSNLIKPMNPVVLNSVDELEKLFENAVNKGFEGLVLMNRNSHYKFGRITLNEGVGYKMKDNDHTYTGTILAVEEGTFVREGALRTTNELGRSVTSKLQEDRIPGGYAKGFQVRTDEGVKLIVSLVNYSQPDKEILWENRSYYVGKHIKFKAMEPVKLGGAPRHAKYFKPSYNEV